MIKLTHNDLRLDRYNIKKEYDKELDVLINKGQKVHIIGFNVIKTSTSSGAEIINGFATEFGLAGASSAVVDIVSSSSTDDGVGLSTSAAAVQVKMFGLDVAYDYTQETLYLTGTSAVTTSTTWSRLISMWVSDCNAGGSSNVGAITCHNTASTSYTFMTIAAATNGISTMRMFVAPNWHCHIHRTRGSIVGLGAGTTAATLFYPDYDDNQGVGYNNPKKIAIEPYGEHDDAHYFDNHFEPTEEPAKLTWFEQANNSASLYDCQFCADLVLFPLRESLSSQIDFIQEV